MGRRGYAIVFGACATSVALAFVVANHFYWGATINGPEGRYYLFGEELPLTLGQSLWVTILPLLAVSLLATAWSLYRLVRAWRARPPAGVCRACGYDLRASPGRCPECGTPVV